MDTPYHLRILPARRFFELKNLSELWTFRELLVALAIRDIKLRYRQTALGVAWVILQPLLASGVLAFVFGVVAGVTKPSRSSVFVFVLAGFIGWSFFNAAFSRASQSLLQHSALISKVFFPRIILPASAIISALVDLAVALPLFLLVVFLSRTPVGWEIVTVPVWLGLILILSFGLGLISASLSVRFRDVQYIAPVFVQILFYASPIAYQTAAVPEKWRPLFLLNPLASAFEGLRWSLVGEGQPDLSGASYCLFVSFFVLVLGLLFFRSAEREFADVI
ncbi:MAG: phosphate ABC transporter permease [Acidobacteria bacterium]|nr:MAG: phosphate ABC transporter permease [Acidobacteriota bacterium]